LGRNLELEELLNKMVEDGAIREEDRDVMRVCLSVLRNGANYERVKEEADCEKFDEYWEILKKNGYFRWDGKIVIEPLTDNTPIYLMALCAQGFVRRHLPIKRRRIRKRR